MALTTPDQSTWTPVDTGGLLAIAPADAVVDNIFVYSSAESDTGKVRRVIDGTYRASWGGILPTASAANNTSRLNSVLSNAGVKEVVFDIPEGGDILLSGAISGGGKTIRISPGIKFTNTYTIQNAILDAPYDQFVLGGTPTLSNVKTVSGSWSPKWTGALGDGTTNDTAAISAINNIAASSSQKNVLFLGSSGKYIINSNISVLAGVVWQFDGGIIGSSNGSTVTFGQRWEAPVSRVFDDNIVIKCGYEGAQVDPFNWGAVANSISVGDDTQPVKRALAALPDSGGYVILNGLYRFDPATFVYPKNTPNNWSGKTEFRISGLVQLLSTWYIDNYYITITGQAGGYGPSGQFGLGPTSSIFGPTNGHGVVVRSSGSLLSYVYIGANGIYDALVYDGTAFPAVPCANHVLNTVVAQSSSAPTAGSPLTIKDAFWISATNCVFNARSGSSHSIFIGDVDPTVSGSNCVAINFTDVILNSKGIHLGATSAGGPAVSYINFNRVVLENPEEEMFIINSVYNTVSWITITDCWKADDIEHDNFLINTGNKTRNVTIVGEDSRSVAPVAGDPIFNLQYQGFPGLSFPYRVFENPNLRQIKQVGSYNDLIRWNGAINTGAKVARWASQAITVSNNFNATITPSQPDPQGGSSAYLVTATNPGSGNGSVAWGNYDITTFTNGDHIIYGVWVKSGGDYGNSISSFAQMINLNLPVGSQFEGGGISNSCNNYKDIDTRSWQFYLEIAQIATAGPSGTVVLSSPIRANFPLYFYNPFMIRIPASESVPKDEVVAYAKECYGVPSATPAGTISITPNASYNVSTGYPQLKISGEFLESKSVRKSGTLTANPTFIAIVAGTYIKRIAINPTSDLAAFAMGTSNGGNQIQDPQPIASGSWSSLNVDRYYASDGFLWINGITSNTPYVLFYD